MKLKDLFKKDINRSIETVIKADDKDNVLQEVEEYVITNEIAKKLTDFFETYNHYDGINGVWISGFFGSGKSHLLKILSYVLENRTLDGKHLGELFAAKVTQDAKLKADILSGTRIDAESILFNIDQQAQITSKTDANAILEVFYKVFYDHLGYYGFRPHVAEFEAWLAKEDKYESFKSSFESEYGKTWKESRVDYVNPLIADAIANACAKVFNADASKYEDILDKYDDKQKFSIEHFAEKVNAYVQSKKKGFRLNFFVDEIGQYIADNTKLMLNLQTIAESLATRCKGQSWIIVTSQEDLEMVIGDDSKAQTNDFSKIIGRFRIRIPLTSANVDEVIEKRLLEKADTAENTLKQMWTAEKDNMATLLSFSDSGIQYKWYKGDADFVSKYPFTPYQFDLFQWCIKALSRQNAFQGKHASVGERSMLGVFQEVLKDIKDDNERTLVSFDQLFEGIRSTIKGEVQNAITLAEKQLNNQLAVKILKALFLVKYYDNFKKTKKNIAVLMIDSLDIDLKSHEKAIDEALNLLEQQTYVQRNGETYEYLTDDEKDIEEAIKTTDYDPGQLTVLFNEIIFDEIIKDTRIKYLDNKQEYEFSRKVDGVIFSREKELTIEVMTPESKDYFNEGYCPGQSMGNNALVIFKLPADGLLGKDAKTLIKTDKYIKQNQSTTNKDGVKRILFDKAQQNIERRRQIISSLKNQLADATVYLNGTVHTVSNTTDGRTKVTYAFQDLIKLAYPKLKLLGTYSFDEQQLKNIMRTKTDDLFANDDNTLSAAENEMLQLVQRRKKQDDRTTLNDLKEHFSKKPYGWPPFAVWGVVGRLYKRGKIEARQDSNILEDDKMLDSMMNNRHWSNTLVYPQVDFDQSQIKKLKDFYQSLFNESLPFTEAKEIASQFKTRILAELADLRGLLTNKHQYKFLTSAEPFVEALDKMAALDYASLINTAHSYENELLDLKDDILDPIRKFWNGEQKKIYDKAATFINGNQSNFDYIESEEKAILESTLASLAPYKGDTMKKTKQAIDELKRKLLEKIEEERKTTLALIDQRMKDVEQREDFKKLDGILQNSIIQPFRWLTDKVNEQTFIANIRDYSQKVEDRYIDQLNAIAHHLSPKKKDGQVNEDTPQYIKSSNIKVAYDGRELHNEEEVEAYLQALKKALMEQISKHRKITLN